MPTSISEKFITVNELREKGNYNEALNLVLNIENNKKLTTEDRVECKLLKGWVYLDKGKVNEALEISEELYRNNREMGNEIRVLDAIDLMGWAFWYLNLRSRKAEDLVMEFEDIVKNLRGVSKVELTRRRAQLMEKKSGISSWKGESELVLEYSQNALQLYEEIDNKIGIVNNLFFCALQCGALGKYDQALEYSMRLLELAKKMENNRYIITSMSQITSVFVSKGELDHAIDYGKQALAYSEVRNSETRFETFDTIGVLIKLGEIYRTKGELDQALEYNKQASSLAEGLKLKFSIGQCLINMGEILYNQGELDQALVYLKKALTIGEETKHLIVLYPALFNIIRVSVDLGFIDNAKRYLTIFNKYLFIKKDTNFYEIYRAGRAYILKASDRAQDKKEAEKLLIKVTEGEIADHSVNTLCLIYLCEILLDRLKKTNNLEILNKIKSIINRVLIISEEQHSYNWLIYAQLLQAKLVLIEKDLTRARFLFTQAQQTSEWHGLNLLAQKISLEHDKILEELESWQHFEYSKESLSERIKLSGVANILEIIGGKKAIEIPELEVETPILLTIMSKTGYLVLTNPFSPEITFDEKRIGEFVSFFNSISDQMFSKSLDRAKFGEHTILLKAHDSLSICYLFEGKSYLAKLRLNSFYEAIKADSMIMQLLNSAIHT
ncbi:MAG: tetratricopeptide repeat protein, partial [Promethearchaeota archaeon]